MNKIDELDLALIREKDWVYPPCPHCGKRDYVYTNNRAYGWIGRQFDERGLFMDLLFDRMGAAPSKTVRCCSCGKVRKDLIIINLQIYPKSDLTFLESVV